MLGAELNYRFTVHGHQSTWPSKYMKSKVHSFQSIGFQIGYMAFEVHDFQSK